MNRLLAVRLIFSLAVPLVASLAIACSGGSDKKTDAAPEATQAASGDPAVQALSKHVETTMGKQFVEDCSKAQAGQDTGKICSFMKGERGNQRAYTLGMVASEPSQWAILELQGTEWKVAYTQPITRDNSGVPGVPWPLKPGAEVVVAGAAPCVNVREGPALNQKAVDCIRDGTKIKLAAGPAAVDNINWWQVDGRSGWVAGDFLRYADAAQ
jgi:hypothetical protein